MRARRGFLVGGIIVAVAFGALIYKAFSMFGSYSLSVTQFREMAPSLGLSVGELLSAPPAVGGGEVQVRGWLVDAPPPAPNGSQPRFMLTDGQKNLPVLYKGTLPGTFARGTEVIVRGRTSGGALEAKRVTATKEVRIEGPLSPDAEVTYDVATRTTRFTITDGEDMSGPRQKLPVVYTGAVPDTFFADVKRVDVSMVVIGREGPGGVFIASQILTKCASKYEAATPVAG